MEKLRVEVTASDIAEGIPADCERCAIALAIKRARPGARVSVVEDTIEIDGDQFTPPPEAVAFIDSFDRDKERCNPFGFDLGDE